MMSYRHSTLWHALILWAITAALGAVGGWSVSLFGYLIIPLAVGYGWCAGIVLSKLGAKHVVLSVLLSLSSALSARVLVAAYLLCQPDIPVPPHGAWQVLYDLVIPWPLPGIALALIHVALGLSMAIAIKRNIRPFSIFNQ